MGSVGKARALGARLLQYITELGVLWTRKTIIKNIQNAHMAAGRGDNNLRVAWRASGPRRLPAHFDIMPKRSTVSTPKIKIMKIVKTRNKTRKKKPQAKK